MLQEGKKFLINICLKLGYICSIFEDIPQRKVLKVENCGCIGRTMFLVYFDWKMATPMRKLSDLAAFLHFPDDEKNNNNNYNGREMNWYTYDDSKFKQKLPQLFRANHFLFRNPKMLIEKLIRSTQYAQ